MANLAVTLIWRLRTYLFYSLYVYSVISPSKPVQTPSHVDKYTLCPLHVGPHALLFLLDSRCFSIKVGDTGQVGAEETEYSKTSRASISALAGKVFLIEEMMPGKQYLLSTESTGLPRTKMQRKNKFCLSPLEMRCLSSPALGLQSSRVSGFQTQIRTFAASPRVPGLQTQTTLHH